MRSINMTWVVVDDLDRAIKFYTDVVGLNLQEHVPEFGWAELQGNGGCRLGLATGPHSPGGNAVIAISVDDIDAASKEMQGKGAKLIGDMIEIPGHVKLQDMVDPDGNQLQLAQKLD
jgi:predicted enzyme related to lactoylglutathione lyase